MIPCYLIIHLRDKLLFFYYQLNDLSMIRVIVLCHIYTFSVYYLFLRRRHQYHMTVDTLESNLLKRIQVEEELPHP